MSDELRVTSDECAILETVECILRRMEGWAARFRVDLEPVKSDIYEYCDRLRAAYEHEVYGLHNIIRELCNQVSSDPYRRRGKEMDRALAEARKAIGEDAE